MDKIIDRSGVFEERAVDRSVSRKNDLLSLLVQIKMVGQRGGVMGDPKTAERQGFVKPQDLSRPESLKANPCLDVFFPQLEQVQKTAGEGDRLLGTQEPDLPIIKDQAMDERRQAIDMVRMDMGEDDSRDLAGIEIELPDLGHDAPGAVDEDELSARSEQDRGIVPLRRGHPAAGTQKIYFCHVPQRRAIFKPSRSLKSNLIRVIVATIIFESNLFLPRRRIQVRKSVDD